MKILVQVKLPMEPFNSAVRDGTVGDTIQKILEATKPEAIYFTESDGCRGAVMILNIDSPSQLPSLAEPWFLKFNAEWKARLVMSPEDLAAGGLEDLGKKWSS